MAAEMLVPSGKSMTELRPARAGLSSPFTVATAKAQPIGRPQVTSGVRVTVPASSDASDTFVAERLTPPFFR